MRTSLGNKLWLHYRIFVFSQRNSVAAATHPARSKQPPKHTMHRYYRQGTSSSAKPQAHPTTRGRFYRTSHKVPHTLGRFSGLDISTAGKVFISCRQGRRRKDLIQNFPMTHRSEFVGSLFCCRSTKLRKTTQGAWYLLRLTAIGNQTAAAVTFERKAVDRTLRASRNAPHRRRWNESFARGMDSEQNGQFALREEYQEREKRVGLL